MRQNEPGTGRLTAVPCRLESLVGWAKRSVPTAAATVGTLRFAHPTTMLPFDREPPSWLGFRPFRRCPKGAGSNSHAPGHSKNDLELANPIGQIMPDQRTVPISKTVKLAEINPVAGL